MTKWDFPCSDPVDISIDGWGSGSIVVSGEPTDTIVVEVVTSHHRGDTDLLDQIQVGFDDGQLYVTGPRATAFRRRQGLDLTIKAPAGSTCAAKTASADVSCVGEISAVMLETASGDLTAGSVGDAAMRSASGDLLLRSASGKVSVHTASGDVQAGRVDGEILITTASGDVNVGYCAGPVAIRTASGDVRLDAVGGGRLRLGSASGDLTVAVMAGLGVYLDLASNSGSISSELDAQDSPEAADASAAALEISCRTTSGDITIVKARAESGEPAPVQ